MNEMRDFDAERRRILRRLGLLTWALWLGAAALAVAGGAFVAWFFLGAGLPFGWTWLATSTLLLGVPLAIHLFHPAGGRDGRADDSATSTRDNDRR